jgi:hypothetical protein
LWVPDGCLTPRQTDQLTVGHYITLTLTWTAESTLTLALGIPSAWGYNWATMLLGEINTGTWSSRLGKSQMRQ